MKELVGELIKQNALSIEKNYLKNADTSLLITETIIKSKLEEMLIDSNRLSFIDFSKKYINTSDFFECKDFTSTEINRIISETPLTERDRKIAVLRYIECKSEEDISSILYIDKKTVHSNIPKISILLKRTAHKIFNVK